MGKDKDNEFDDTSTSSADTIVSSQVKVEGDIKSDGNIQIDGELKGTITTEQDLGVGETAVIEADIHSRNAVVAGTVKGNITVKEGLELTETAKVLGNIKTKVLSISAGATFKGQCEMAGMETENTEELGANEEE